MHGKEGRMVKNACSGSEREGGEGESCPYGAHPVRHIHHALVCNELQHTAVRLAPRRVVTNLKKHRVVDVQRRCEKRRARARSLRSAPCRAKQVEGVSWSGTCAFARGWVGVAVHAYWDP